MLHEIQLFVGGGCPEILPVIGQVVGFLLAFLIGEAHAALFAEGRIAEVPTISICHLTKAQIKAYQITDNRLCELSSWDDALLGDQLKILTEEDLDFSIEATGFTMGEIDVRISNLDLSHENEPDTADELPKISDKPPVTKLGDIWNLGPHKIVCGNSLEEEAMQLLMGDDEAHLVFTDPPYNVPIAGHVSGLGSVQHAEFAMASGEMTVAQFTDFLKSTCLQLTTYSVNGSIHYICMDWRHMRELLTASECAKLELKNLCVWVKDNGGMGTFYRSQHELIFVFKHGTEPHKNNFLLGQHGRYRTNVWQYPGVNSFARKTDEGNLLELHPTVKPVAMVADAIMDCSDRGDIILDIFLGSGTTLIAAERTGRVCRGMEIDPRYVDTAIARWQKLTGKKAAHVATNRTFDEMEAAHV